MANLQNPSAQTTPTDKGFLSNVYEKLEHTYKNVPIPSKVFQWVAILILGIFAVMCWLIVTVILERDKYSAFETIGKLVGIVAGSAVTIIFLTFMENRSVKAQEEQEKKEQEKKA